MALRLILLLALSTLTGYAQIGLRSPTFLGSLSPPAAAGGGLGTQLGSDAFTRANETPLASPWVAGSAVANTRYNLSGNSVTPELISHDAVMFLSGVTWTSNQYAQVAVTVTGTSAGSGPGLALRVNTATPNGTYYRVCVSKNANAIEIGKVVADVYSGASARTTTWVDGDILGATITGTTTAIITVYQNGVQVGATYSDASSALQAGSPGISYSSTSTSCTLDNFAAGSVP